MSASRNVALESVMVQEALYKLPTQHRWTSVRVWVENDEVLGVAGSGTDVNMILTNGEWEAVPV